MKFTHQANPVLVNARTIQAQRSFNLIQFVLSDGEIYTPKEGMLSRYTPQVGDYLVTQEDGYEYFNPKEVFERKYSIIGE